MIIDIHTHIFPDIIAERTIDKLSKEAHIHPYTDGTAKGLLKSMEDSAVNLSVIVPVATNPGQVVKINDNSARINEIYGKDGLLSFGCMHPEYEDYKNEIKRMKRLGLKGVKLHPVYQGTDIDDVRFLRIIEASAEEGLIVITHAGLDVGFPGKVNCSPKMCRNVVKEIGDFPFICAHMGGWKNWEEVPEYLADTKVYLDTAFSTGVITPRSGEEGHWDPEEKKMLDEDGFLKMLYAFGADRLLFGTDSPWTDQSESKAFIEDLYISKEEKEKILGKNAERLLS
ncbi:MAG: amidohydrolase family protein [Lachnospiraceae bacterium]|nr:amidohydrolase family protein [Lachnospiraceae bacterium]